MQTSLKVAVYRHEDVKTWWPAVCPQCGHQCLSKHCIGATTSTLNLLCPQCFELDLLVPVEQDDYYVTWADTPQDLRSFHLPQFMDKFGTLTIKSGSAGTPVSAMLDTTTFSIGKAGTTDATTVTTTQVFEKVPDASQTSLAQTNDAKKAALLDLIGKYWDLAQAHVREHLTTDDENGSAQKLWAEIQQRIRDL